MHALLLCEAFNLVYSRRTLLHVHPLVASEETVAIIITHIHGHAVTVHVCILNTVFF